MKCTVCGGQGYVETWHGGGASWTPSLVQCRNRCNISGYSDEVQKRINNPDHVTESPVLPSMPSERPRMAQVISIFDRRSQNEVH